MRKVRAKAPFDIDVISPGRKSKSMHIFFFDDLPIRESGSAIIAPGALMHIGVAGVTM
jgi:hypothetical protein